MDSDSSVSKVTDGVWGSVLGVVDDVHANSGPTQPHIEWYRGAFPRDSMTEA
jgi:hypothetical protein